MGYESILLDVDGTLWDSRQIVMEGWNLGLEVAGLARRFTMETITPLFGKTITQIGELALPDLDPVRRSEVLEQCFSYEHKLLAEGPCDIFYPGVKDLIPVLAERHRVFIISNCQKGYIENLLDHSGLWPWVTDRLCFSDTGKSKGENIALMLQKHQITSGVYVGDTVMDQQAADHAGIPFLWASYGFGKPEHWDGKLETFGDLLKVV